MRLFPITYLAFLSIISFGQKPPIKFGDVPTEDLKMEIYEKDPSAPAIVLADFGESIITYDQTRGFDLKFKRIRRIKILKKEGYEWANHIIPIYKKNNIDEKVSNLKAITINLEGGKIQQTKLEKSNIFTENVNENWDHIKLTLPNVKEGSVIDITYQVTSPYLFNFQDWEFQSTIPTRWSEYIAHIPEYFEYRRFAQGYIGLTVNDVSSQQRIITLTDKQRAEGSSGAPTSFTSHEVRYTENNFRWAAADVPAFKEEPFMTTHRDYISKLNFELYLIRLPNRPVETVMGTWQNINKELMDSDNFGEVVKRSTMLKSIVDLLIAGTEGEEEKLSKIFSYVKSNIEWDGTYRVYANGNFKKAIDEKKGSSADINLMLVSMLQKAGFNANPVAISTRNHGFIRQEFPLSSQFNYVLCSVQLNDQIILLDATDRTLPINMLPERCLNGTGLLISDSESRWIELKSNVKTRTLTESDLQFDATGKLKGVVKVIKEGYHGQQMRISLFEQGEETYLNKLKDASGWTIHSSKFDNTKDVSQPLKVMYDLSFSEENSALADIIYLNPLFGNGIKDNPFKLETREYPVDFGSGFENTDVIKLSIPDGYEVEELPKPLALALPNNGGRYIYNINQMNGQFSLTSQFLINKGLYTQLEYQNLREFYAKVIAKQQEQLVLRKIK